MILTDYFRYPHDITWDFARQIGVTHGVIRLPETADFDVNCKEHFQTVYKQFTDYGIQPIILEPMPNALHDHIKIGDDKRDACIVKVIRMLPLLVSIGIHTICFNFMAHIGWLRTRSDLPDRGGALVTGFDLQEFTPDNTLHISEETLWDNYFYFLDAVLPYAEKYGITLALHPDDPPLAKLGHVSRIMTSEANIKRALMTKESPFLGLTMCQATFAMMGEDVYSLIPAYADKIKFVHFRNVTGTKTCFRETFHDNGSLDMKRLIQLYKRYTPDVPIRVDHVPTMAGEKTGVAGYDALGRLFAIGYLKGLLEEEKSPSLVDK